MFIDPDERALEVNSNDGLYNYTKMKATSQKTFNWNENINNPYRGAFLNEAEAPVGFADLGNNLESLVQGLEQRRKDEERRLQIQRQSDCTIS